MTTTSSSGRRVLVTGSSRGIGVEIAYAFARNGDEVDLHGRDREALGTAQGSIASSGC